MALVPVGSNAIDDPKGFDIQGVNFLRRDTNIATCWPVNTPVPPWINARQTVTLVKSVYVDQSATRYDRSLQGGDS